MSVMSLESSQPSIRPDTMPRVRAAPVASSALRLLPFRFGFCYWVLFCIPALGIPIPGVDTPPQIVAAWGVVTTWVGHNVLGITREIPIQVTGSGDTTSDWVSLFCYAVLALVASLAWSLAGRARTDHPRHREALRVLLRYALGLTMFSYGIIKVFRGQFPAPHDARLMQPYGDSSPMGLLWTFMGYSGPYVVFSGLAETAGSLLLFFRRTTTLGALVLAAVLTNVVMLNFCYDVPVKINSAHYLAMAFVLLLPDLRRLADLLVWNRPTAPARYALELPRRWMRIARPLCKYALVGSTVALGAHEAHKATAMPDAVSAWYAGYWDVKTMTRNAVDVPALTTDATRWKRLKLEAWPGKSYLRWHNMDGTYGPLYAVTVDDGKSTLTLSPEEPNAPAASPIAVVRKDATHLHLSGTIGKDAIAVDVERMDPRQKLLMSRGFHWVNEVPFNR